MADAILEFIQQNWEATLAMFLGNTVVAGGLFGVALKLILNKRAKNQNEQQLQQNQDIAELIKLNNTKQNLVLSAIQVLVKNTGSEVHRATFNEILLSSGELDKKIETTFEKIRPKVSSIIKQGKEVYEHVTNTVENVQEVINNVNTNTIKLL